MKTGQALFSASGPFFYMRLQPITLSELPMYVL